MKRYMDSDGDVWAGPDNATLFLIQSSGEVYGVGVSKSHIENHMGELIPLEDD